MGRGEAYVSRATKKPPLIGVPKDTVRTGVALPEAAQPDTI